MDIAQRKQKRWITTVFFFLAGILSATWSSRIPDVQQKMKLNDAAWGTVLVALPIGLVTGLLVSSWLVARFGTQKIMVVGSILSSLLLILLGIAGVRFQLMVVLFFVGFTRTIFNIAVNTNSVELQQNYEKPIISTFHGIWSLACFAAAGIGTLMLILNIAPSFHFLFIAIICITVVLFYRNITKDQDHIVPEKRPFLVKPHKILWLLGCIAFCSMLGENAMFDWSINYFDRVIHAPKSLVTIGYTSFIIMMALGRLVGDRVLHKYGHVKVLLINGSLMAAGFLIAVLFPFLIPAAFGFLLIGIGDSIIVPVVYTLAAKYGKMPPAYSIASITLIGYNGFLLGPLIIGSLSEAFGMRWALAFAGLLAFTITVLAFFVNKYVMQENRNA